MDMSYFEKNVPVIKDFQTILLAMGWALLIGNLVFQSSKTMMTGIGFEGEDPKLLFTRTFVFSFLLVASRPICGIGLNMTSMLMDLLQAPTSIIMTLPEDDTFAMPGDASWLLTLIVGTVLMFQLIKLLFEVGERYVVLGVLTLIAPLAFGMGGSKNTSDIFTGFCRMYGSMCLMMIFNMIFLKMFLSCMAMIPTGFAIFPWLVLMIGIARVAKKIDSIISRIGLNPAITGAPLGAGFPGALAVMAARGLAQNVTKSIGKNFGRPPHAGGPSPNVSPSAPPPPGSHPPPTAAHPDGSAVKSAESHSSQETAQAQLSSQAPTASTRTSRRTSVSEHRPPLRAHPPVRAEGQQNRPQGSAAQQADRSAVPGSMSPAENKPRQGRAGKIIPPGASAGSANFRLSTMPPTSKTADRPGISAAAPRPVTAGTTAAPHGSLVQSAKQRDGKGLPGQAAAPDRPLRQPVPDAAIGNQQANLYSSAQTVVSSPPNLKRGADTGIHGTAMGGETSRIQNRIDGRSTNRAAQNVQSTASSRADSFSSAVYHSKADGQAAPADRRSQIRPNPQGNAVITPPASQPGAVHSINPPVRSGSPSLQNMAVHSEGLTHNASKAPVHPIERQRITSAPPQSAPLSKGPSQRSQPAGKGAVPAALQARPSAAASRPRLPQKTKSTTAKYRKRRRGNR